MVNFSSDRSNLFQNLINNFLFIVNNFDSFFIPNFNLLSDYPTRITELISFLGLIVLIYIVLNSNLGKYFKIEFLSLISFCISILILAFLSREVNSFYVGPRYFFAIIVVFAIYFSYFSSKFRHLLIISCFFAFSLIPITVYIRYYESFNKNKDFFYHLLNGKKSNVIINREEHWDIILMDLKIESNLCTKNIIEKNIDERIIFCSDSDGYVIKDTILKIKNK
tara:strand:- start:109 stop:777 length:669 start_codon:yes stop_codon:yes gene_type:complete